MTIQVKRDTAANWASVDPVLADGQPGYDKTNNALRIGNGASAWSALTAIGGGGGGSGTVTTVSVTTANGFSGSVATATTTPAITITLQDATGAQSGKLTATDWNTFNSKQPAGAYLTANQTITVTGDAAGSGTTAITLTIPADTVTFGKIQNIATNRILGRSTGGSGDIEEITLGTNLTLTAGVLNAASGGGSVTSGTSTVSFGVTETNEAQLVVTGQTGILAGSKVTASIGTTATSDYTANDHKYLGSMGVSVTSGDVVAGTGFTIYVRSYQKIKGDISINWVY